MAYNSHGKRIRNESLAGQVTTTAWDQFACTSVDELISAAKNAKSAKHAYNFDDIGNRRTSLECGVRSAEYAANELNQYTAITTDTSAHFVSPCETFIPLFDADGNQTLVKTATGIWQVMCNGENRPILWACGGTNIVMSYDRMGRRVTKNDQRFVYDDYLQIANHCTTPTPSTYTYFIWDPTEPVATRPLVWFNSALDTPHSALSYTHDGNKNVSEVIAQDGGIAAHYEYAPFGAVAVQSGESAAANPWRFSSEFVDEDTATIYYNYRHYELLVGRWLQHDPIEEYGGFNIYSSNNRLISETDSLGESQHGCNNVGLTDFQGIADEALNDEYRNLSRKRHRTQAENKRLLKIKAEQKARALRKSRLKMGASPCRPGRRGSGRCAIILTIISLAASQVEAGMTSATASISPVAVSAVCVQSENGKWSCECPCNYVAFGAGDLGCRKFSKRPLIMCVRSNGSEIPIEVLIGLIENNDRYSNEAVDCQCQGENCE